MRELTVLEMKNVAGGDGVDDVQQGIVGAAVGVGAVSVVVSEVGGVALAAFAATPVGAAVLIGAMVIGAAIAISNSKE